MPISWLCQRPCICLPRLWMQPGSRHRTPRCELLVQYSAWQTGFQFYSFRGDPRTHCILLLWLFCGPRNIRPTERGASRQLALCCLLLPPSRFWPAKSGQVYSSCEFLLWSQELGSEEHGITVLTLSLKVCHSLADGQVGTDLETAESRPWLLKNWNSWHTFNKQPQTNSRMLTVPTCCCSVWFSELPIQDKVSLRIFRFKTHLMFSVDFSFFRWH